MQRDFSRAGWSSGQSRQLLLHSHCFSLTFDLHKWLSFFPFSPCFQCQQTDSWEKSWKVIKSGALCFWGTFPLFLRTCFGVLVLEGATSEEQCEGGHALFRLILTRSGFGFAKQKAKICLVQGPTLAVTSRKYQPLLIFLRQPWTRPQINLLLCYFSALHSQCCLFKLLSDASHLLPIAVCYSWDL